MARLTLLLLGFWPCGGIQRSGLNGLTPSQWAAGAVLVVSNHVSWLDILVSQTERFVFAGVQGPVIQSSGNIRSQC